jgi:hypothetical protein
MHIRLIATIDCDVLKRREKKNEGEKKTRKGKREKNSCLLFYSHLESIDLSFFSFDIIHKKILENVFDIVPKFYQ